MLARHFVTDPTVSFLPDPTHPKRAINAPTQFATSSGRPRLAVMVEAKAVADGKDNWKKSKEGKKWKWAKLGAVLVVVVAIAMTSRHAQNQKSCSCSQDFVLGDSDTLFAVHFVYLFSDDSRKYTGIVEDCCCDYETVDSLNGAVLYPLLQDLVKTPFFRYFKVKLWCDCPFWPDDGMCKLRDCSVCECPENEFPELFKKPMPRVLGSNDLICQKGKPQATVDRTLDSKVFRGWIEVDNPWTHEDETDNSEMTYVNLLLNPERYTGYTGPSARRIWDAVYSENCQKYSSGEICQEKRVLYKLISGLHSSISIHIASDYLLDEAKNLWGRNPELMYNRVLRYPDRVRNLYFTFMFVLRAVTKAANYLEQAEYDTGNINEDLKAQSLMRQLLDNPKLHSACPLPFDEAQLWQGKGGPELKLEIQKQFRNISALMDCVGCEKCRLWGKLQVLGLGTALKILFSVDGKSYPNEPLELQRNEVIALVNLLNRLSESVKLVNEIGPSIEQSMEKFALEPLTPDISLLQRAWEAVGSFRMKNFHAKRPLPLNKANQNTWGDQLLISSHHMPISSKIRILLFCSPLDVPFFDYVKHFRLKECFPPRAANAQVEEYLVEILWSQFQENYELYTAVDDASNHLLFPLPSTKQLFCIKYEKNRTLLSYDFKLFKRQRQVAPQRFISLNKRPPIKTLDTIDEEKAYSAAFSPSSRKMIDGEGYDRGQVSPF
ncbi:endoplasmic oxidoreductin 1 family protein, partial [Striga asiatica]